MPTATMPAATSVRGENAREQVPGDRTREDERDEQRRDGDDPEQRAVPRTIAEVVGQLHIGMFWATAMTSPANSATVTGRRSTRIRSGCRRRRLRSRST